MKNQSTASTDSADVRSAGPSPARTATNSTAGKNRTTSTRETCASTSSDRPSATAVAMTARTYRATPRSCRWGTITTACDDETSQRPRGGGAVSALGRGAGGAVEGGRVAEG